MLLAQLAAPHCLQGWHSTKLTNLGGSHRSAQGHHAGPALDRALTFIMPCQSKLSTLIGALGQDLRTVRTPSEKCSDSMSSSWRCRQNQVVSAGQYAGSVKQLCTQRTSHSK